MDLFSRPRILPLILPLVILCTLFDFGTSRHHIRHHRDRFKRQQGEHLYLPGSYVTSDGEGFDSGPWGEWSAPSSCSRSCGGGASSQYRQCQPGYTCTGPAKRHFSCNTQDCPDLADYRSQQCSEYDKVPFEGVYYQWIPYTKAPNPCELNCMPRGERFYYRHKQYVTDGTRCNDEKLDVCVEGNCHPVGCDMMLGSRAQEDKCRQCGGDGTMCNTVTGRLDMQDLQVGYNDILLIPAGATNIRVNEVAPSNNYLAVRNTSGHYYLNGNWRIDFPRSLEFAGCKFHYDRYPQGFAAPDSITCLGPTEEPLFVVLLYQDTNVGVDYEYSVPRGVQLASPETYAWTFSEFTPCTATCGGGLQYRNVSCAGRRTLEPADRTLCDASVEPIAYQRCSEEPCPPQWVAKPWEKCSAPCGENGTQTRQVYCEQVIANGVASIVDDASCENVQKPPSQQPCNQGRVCALWHIGPWKPCDHLCGGGKETRQIKCYRKNEGKIELLADEECEQSEEKPPAERPCNMRPCEGTDWLTSEWSGCDTCGLTNQTRRVQCATQKGEIYPDELCEDIPKPESVRQCNNTNDTCEFQWFASQWSECSSKCGPGVQTRKVFCASETEDGIKKVDSGKCDPAKKYEGLMNCTGAEEVCTKGEWFTGPWTPCSKKCGEGLRTRKVICLKDERAVSASECDPETIPFSNEECSNHPCGKDETAMEVTDPMIDARFGGEEETDKLTSVSEMISSSKETEETEETEMESTTSISTTESEESESTSVSSESTSSETEETTEVDTSETQMETSSSDLESEASSDYETVESATTTSETEEEGESTKETETEGDDEFELVETDSCDDGVWVYEVVKDDEDDEEEESTKETPEDLISSSLGSTITDESSTEASMMTDELMFSDDSTAYTKETELTVETGSGDTEMSSTSSSLTSEASSQASSEATSEEGSGDTSAFTDTSESSSSSIGSTQFTESSISTEGSSSTEYSSSTSESSSSMESSTSQSSSEFTSTTDLSSISTDGSSSSDSSSDTTTYETTLVTSSDESSSTEFSSTSGYSSESTSQFTSESTSEITSESTTEITSESSSQSSSEVSSESTTEYSTSLSTEEGTSSGSTDGSSSTDMTGSTDGTGSTEVSSSTTELIGSSTEMTGGSESTDASESSTQFSGSTGSTDMTESVGSTETDIWSSTTESDVSSEGTTAGTWGTSEITEIFLGKKKQKRFCKRRVKKVKKPDCATSKYGCCIDKVTPAQGPFDKGCPTVTTCKETKFGCCEDGVSVALGKNYLGCPSTHCNETLFGCCPDKKTPAEGNNNEGCPPPRPKCMDSKYGCCKDNVTAAKGPKQKGCKVEKKEKEAPSTRTQSRMKDLVNCTETKYGCCPDGKETATGVNFEGCDIFKDNCTESYFGCCPDRNSSAKGPRFEGCKTECAESQFGCCEDGITPAHGPSREGCCLATQHGCCPDNITPAQGPNLEGCGCQYSPYRCCPDNITAARGYNNEGCGCKYTEHGCCPDNYTPAAGKDFQGCLCHTFQFGCCPDGVTVAKGPHQQGCGCRNTEFGCCSDNQTPAEGPDYQGCKCDASAYGCCLDGVAEAKGENYEGCEELPINLQDSCTQQKERGSCRNYTVKWFFDMEYGGCSRFWYGGCEGNDNRFKSKEECTEVCVEPQGTERCLLPKVVGPCEGYYPQWYFDKERKTCTQFIYGGCLGNNNRFETREECAELCVKDSSVDACEQVKDEGPCRGNYQRWYFDKASGTCQPFHYGGCKANNNNFPTEHACKQQCAQPGRRKDHCSLPRAQGNCTGSQPRWHYDASERRCMPFYYSGCGGNDNNFSSQEACEADCPKEIAKDTCQLPAEVGDCANYTDRWYFDTRERRCRQFYWGGCGGNGNNFQTEQECDGRCSRVAQEPVAPQPQPVPPQTQPSPGYETAPEPFRPEFCFLDNDAGPCREFEARWFYDKNDGVCKQFMYGGCPGNQNNFKTGEECHQYCGNAQELCSLPMVVGPCSGEYDQWHYNNSLDACVPFKYGGCLGNDNRFDDQASCENRCKSTRVTEGYVTPLLATSPPDSDVSICYVPVDAGNCNESIPSYYYDPSAQKCSAFIYTGCGGNANRYNSEEQCERQCGRFRGQDVCRLPRDPGPCRGYFVKFYYDIAAGRCGQFAYGGCEGNGNRFSSLEECEYICVTHEEKKPPVFTNETASVICRLPVDVGPCEGGYHKHYYFDDSRGECVPFIYSGCGGNFNNFKSFQACLDFCREFVTPTELPPSEVGPSSQPEERCQQYLDECGTIRCEYGTEAYVDEQILCTRCRCHEPCRDVMCDNGTQCAVDLNRNRTVAEDPNFIAVCRPVTKDGECPQIGGSETRCERECENDADCSVDLKCCSTGCGTACVAPAMRSAETPAELVTVTPHIPSYTDNPDQAGFYAPVINEEVFEPSVNAGEGDYANLKCAVKGNPTPTITWKKGDLFIDGTQPRYRLLLDGVLQIITLHKTDSGIYLCAADNGVGQPLQKEVELVVTDSQPHSTAILGEEDSHVVAALGAPAALQCYAIGYPFPAVTWWKDDSMIPLKTSQFEVRKDYSLLIHSIQLSNLGIYTCQAYNGIGKAASWSVTVQALGPVYSTRPEDEKYMKYVIGAPERPTTEPQSIPSFSPRPTPQPYEPPPYEEPSPEIVPNELFPLPSAAGRRVYQVPVRTNITQNQQRYPTGSDIVLGCEVDGYPIPQVQWYKDGQPLYPSENVQISESYRLTVHHANKSDSGEYRCEASNQYSRSASSTTITVEGIYIHPNCTDNQFFANCQLIVRARYCTHKYYARFCCLSCTQAGQLPSYGPHLGVIDERHNALSSNLVRRRRALYTSPGA